MEAVLDLLEETLDKSADSSDLKSALSNLRRRSDELAGLFILPLSNFHSTLSSGGRAADIERFATMLSADVEQLGAIRLADFFAARVEGRRRTRSELVIWPLEGLARIGGPDVKNALEAGAIDIMPLKSALSLLRQYWPEALEWIALVAKNISIVRGPPKRLISGSFNFYPGFFYFSVSDDPVDVAEMLIHEASHQFFLLACDIEPAVYRDDKQFYSPFVQRERPLSKLMLGFHAFCNVRELYDRLDAAKESSNFAGGPSAPAYDLDDVREVLRRNVDNMTRTGLGLVQSRL